MVQESEKYWKNKKNVGRMGSILEESGSVGGVERRPREQGRVVETGPMKWEFMGIESEREEGEHRAVPNLLTF
jgi:hypothetical protein